MKAISIRQPWAWLIVNGFKDVENRKWKTKFRGRVLIHSSKGCTKSEYQDAVSTVRHIDPSIVIPRLEDLERGGIVGRCDLTDCVDKSDSPWFFGRYGFVLKDAKPVEFEPLKGALGFFSTGS